LELPAGWLHYIFMAIADNDADRFRRQAEVCRKESEKAHSLVDAASWLRLADDFDKLAERERERLRYKRHHA
jgi:hypothetical protein